MTDTQRVLCARILATTQQARDMYTPDHFLAWTTGAAALAGFWPLYDRPVKTQQAFAGNPHLVSLYVPAQRFAGDGDLLWIDIPADRWEEYQREAVKVRRPAYL